MSRNRQDRFEFISIPQDTGFVGGMNTLDLATKIADSECVNLINFEYDEADNLVSRHGTTRINIGIVFSSRITSIFYAKLTSGNIYIATSGTDIWNLLTDVSIKGAATLPSDTYWQWRAFNNLAIGVNQGNNTTMNPVKWTGSGNIAQLGLTGIIGAPQNFKYIETWNRRLWLVASNLPNTLHYSNLGDPENWSGAINIDHNDGDIITGIYATRESLFIFKRKKIYYIKTGVGGKVNTDDTGWSVEKVADNVGCVSGYTIQNILNDLVFLSDEGVQSLRAVQEFGNFSIIPLSRKIKQINTFNRNIDTFSSVVFSKKSQYWIMLPDTVTGTLNNVVYVMDYKRLPEGVLRWFQFKFKNYPISTIGSVFRNDDSSEVLYLGTGSPDFHILRKDSQTGLQFNDNGREIYKEFRSKAFEFKDAFRRKEYHKIGALISFTQSNCAVSFNVRFDENDNVSRSEAINFISNVTGAHWDVENWDNGVFSVASNNDKIILLRMSGSGIHRARSAQFTITNNQLTQDLFIKQLATEVGLLELESV